MIPKVTLKRGIACPPLGEDRVGSVGRYISRNSLFTSSQAKIALKANSEDQLLELEAIAKSLNLCARSVVDGLSLCICIDLLVADTWSTSGRTQVEPGTRTVLAIGPAPVSLINEVTGSLRLL